MRGSLLVLSLACVQMLSAGSGFSPIPPEDWKVNAAATQGKGAMFLHKRIQVTDRYVEHEYRIRINSEAGRAGAEFAKFGSMVYDIEGRTVTADGRETPFQKSDLQSKTLAKVGTDEAERKVLIPPGVTSDCIVDIRWRESKSFSERLAFGIGSLEYLVVSGALPVRRAVLEVPYRFLWSWSLSPGQAGKVQAGERSIFRQFNLENIPAVEEVPYAIDGARSQTAMLFWFNPDELAGPAKDGPDAYWDAVGKELLKFNFVNRVSLGRAYRLLSEQLRKDLPAGIHASATELLKRLDSRIRNTSAPTFEEKARQSKSEADADIDPWDLKQSAERGYTTSWGMTYLFFQLLKDHGITPKIALVADRDRWIFKKDHKAYQQFHDVLIGVAEPGRGVLWFDPGWRWAMPGLISNDYQGTPGLQYDSATWKAVPFQVPVQASLVNQRHAEYHLQLEEQEDQFRATVRFSGLREINQRRKHMALEPKEQNRLLKETLEKDWPKVQISKSEVQNAQDPAKNVAFALAGRIEREPSRRRSVDPFPLESLTLWVPGRMEANRTEMIALPYAQIHTAVSRFQIPAGYRLGELAPFEQSNAFGSVLWKVERNPSEGAESITVTLRVEVGRTYAAAADYEAFKAFLGWIKDAGTRVLILERK